MSLIGNSDHPGKGVVFLRPVGVYTGDFSGDFCCDFKCDFVACKLLAIQIAAESPVVYTGDLKSP